jgi:hypothetical protein
MDGTTARRMAEQLGGKAPALTIEQLKVRLESGALEVGDRTVIFLDEASKLDTGHWAEIANAVQRHGAAVRAVGHDGQHDAIRLPGLFSEMLAHNRIPTAALRQIRRHRDPHDPAQVHPWLRDYQIAVDQGRGVDAVAILQEHSALNLHDTRAHAMGAMVDKWDRWRRGYQPNESALIVHGPNSDVDLVNELAQRKRLDAGELGERAIRAVDRDYLLRPGDVVAIRNAAYAFDAQPGTPRPKRIENGQTAIVESVDSERDTLTLLLREPGAEPRLVQIDQARLRSEHAACKRTAAVRLNYALHSFPAQGATMCGTATLAGHWSQAKQQTYVGDTRAIYRHSVHVARDDLGTDGTDEDRLSRYAQRISANRQRQASIGQALDPTMRLAVDLPDREPLPAVVTTAAPSGPNDSSSEISSSTRDASLNTASPCPGHGTSPHIRADDMSHGHRSPTAADLARSLSDPPEHLIRALGPVPTETVARERWEREARRLEALNAGGNASQPIASPWSTPSHQRERPRATPPPPQPQPRDAPTIRPSHGL